MAFSSSSVSGWLAGLSTDTGRVDESRLESGTTAALSVSCAEEGSGTASLESDKITATLQAKITQNIIPKVYFIMCKIMFVSI